MPWLLPVHLFSSHILFAFFDSSLVFYPTKLSESALVLVCSSPLSPSILPPFIGGLAMVALSLNMDIPSVQS